MLLCVCYDLRPGILIKPQKGKDGRGSREFTCPLWLYCYAVAPDLHSRFPSPHPIGIIKLRTTGVGAGVWAHSGNWRIEQGGWVVGGSCCCRCFPFLPQRQVCLPDLSPWPPRPSPTKRIRKLPVRRNCGLGWPDSWPAWDRLVWAPSGLRAEADIHQPHRWVPPITLTWNPIEKGMIKSGLSLVRASNLDPSVPKSLSVGGFSAEDQTFFPITWHAPELQLLSISSNETTLRYTLILPSGGRRYICEGCVRSKQFLS